MIYAVHLHQRQENARYKDELFRVESQLEAFFKIQEIAEDHGYFHFTLEELETKERVELRSTVIKLLRSKEFEIEDVYGEAVVEDEDWYEFELESPHAPDVRDRSIRLKRYVASSDAE